MDADLALILGIIIGGFCSMNFADFFVFFNTQTLIELLILIPGSLVLFAMMTHPGGYSIEQLPDVFFGVIARFIP